jgi:hypothetical protein
MNFKIVRTAKETEKPTTGRLLIGEVSVMTLELPWLDNQPNVSCIPEGTYRTVLAFSNRYGKIMPRILGVPDRSGILIHPGNTPHDTNGCILVGMTQKPNGTLINSRVAFKLFFDWLGMTIRYGDVFCEVTYA